MNSKQNEPKSAEDLLEALLGPGAATKKTLSGTPTTMDSDDDADPIDPIEEDEDLSATESPQANEISAGTEATSAADRSRRRQRAQPATQPKRARIGIGYVLAAAILIGGVGATLLDPANPIRAALSGVGLDAPVLLTVGAVTFVLAAVRRQHALAVERYEELSRSQQDTRDELQEHLRRIAEHQHVQADRPPAEGEELERVLTALDRQDEKIGNITRALKMYGKPLMEIATQGNDLAAHVARLEQQMESFDTAMQQGLSRLAEGASSRSVDLGPLEAKLVEFAADTRRTLSALGDRIPSEHSLQQQLVRVEAQITALSQRLDDSEMRKSLLRLEDSNKLHGKKLEQLAHQDAVHEEVQRLEKLVDTTIGKLTRTVDQVRDKDLGTLENTVRDIQREVSGLATSVAYIQQTIRGVAARGPIAAASVAQAPVLEPAVAGAVRSETAPTVASQVAQPSEMPPSAAPTPAPGATQDAQAGVAENRTGTRATSSKNVLGAIQKLKKMKG